MFPVHHKEEDERKRREDEQEVGETSGRKEGVRKRTRKSNNLMVVFLWICDCVGVSVYVKKNIQRWVHKERK